MSSISDTLLISQQVGRIVEGAIANGSESISVGTENYTYVSRIVGGGETFTTVIDRHGVNRGTFNEEGFEAWRKRGGVI